jgi:DNA-binding transcriptional regulator PaaX
MSARSSGHWHLTLMRVPQIDHRIQAATKKSGILQEFVWLALIGDI